MARDNSSPREEPDLTSRPEAFATANREARHRYIQSLDLEKAAEDLEDVLAVAYELLEASEAAGLPSPENPLPGPTLAILLEGKPSPED